MLTVISARGTSFTTLSLIADAFTVDAVEARRTLPPLPLVQLERHQRKLGSTVFPVIHHRQWDDERGRQKVGGGASPRSFGCLMRWLEVFPWVWGLPGSLADVVGQSYPG
jgi:hypothetical protein